MSQAKTVRVLFVCMGNICRSPMGQGVFERLVEEAGLRDRIQVDSAGTHAYHVGKPPDERAQRAAAARGYVLHTQRARQVVEEDFHRADYVLAMDRDNLVALQEICPAELQGRIRLFMEFSELYHGRDVPDPYYGDTRGFERVLDMVEDAARGLLREIRRRYRL
jgi:protein-tyrosine phosphatase